MKCIWFLLLGILAHMEQGPRLGCNLSVIGLYSCYNGYAGLRVSSAAKQLSYTLGSFLEAQQIAINESYSRY